jgi:hypothetical protein
LPSDEAAAHQTAAPALRLEAGHGSRIGGISSVPERKREKVLDLSGLFPGHLLMQSFV